MELEIGDGKKVTFVETSGLYKRGEWGRVFQVQEWGVGETDRDPFGLHEIIRVFSNEFDPLPKKG